MYQPSRVEVWQERLSPFDPNSQPIYYDTFSGTPGTLLTAHTSDSGATYTTVTGQSNTFELGSVPEAFAPSVDQVIVNGPASTSPNPHLLLGTVNPQVNSGLVQLMIDADNALSHANGVQITSMQVNAFVNFSSPTYYNILMYGTQTQNVPIGLRRWITGGNAVVTAFYNNSPVTTVVATNAATTANVMALGSVDGWGIENVSAVDEQNGIAAKGVVCEGDSLTWGGGGAVTSPGGATAGNSYPAELQILLEGYLTVEVANIGYPGYEISQMLPSRTTQLMSNPAFSVKWAIFWGGINDAAGGASASTMLAGVATWAAAMVAAGVSFCICELCYIGPNASSSYVAINAQIDAFNAGLNSTYNSSTQKVVPLNANANLSTWTNTAYRMTDQVHFTVLGYALIAQIVRSVLPI